MTEEKQPVWEWLCGEHISEAPVVTDIEDGTHVYWARREHDPSGEICEFANCTESADWVCFSRRELEMTDDTRYVPADDTHAKLQEILVALRASEQPAVKLQLKSGTGTNSREGYELTVTDAVTEASLQGAFDAAMRGREMIHAKLYEPINPYLTDPDDGPVAHG